MQELLKQISSLSWWIGVVLVGVLVNIASPFISRAIERRLSRFSDWQRRRSQSKQEKRQTLLNNLRADPHKQVLFAIAENRYRVRSSNNFLVSLLAVGFATGFLYIGRDIFPVFAVVISALLFLCSVVGVLFSLDDTREAIEVKKILAELNPDLF